MADIAPPSRPEPPPIGDEWAQLGGLLAALAADYGLAVSALCPHRGGFASDCWVADGRWLVKRWPAASPPVRLDVLTRLRAAGLPVPAPLPTTHGAAHAGFQGRAYAVFPFVPGRPQTEGDWRLTAGVLKRIHQLRGIELPPRVVDEPQVWPLREHLDHPWIADRRAEVAGALRRLERVIERARAKAVRSVVCHQDLHGDNLIIDGGEVVAILDWEQAVLGPREHDLWIAADHAAHGGALLAEYGARDLDLDHIEFALLARALRDMAARVLTGVDRPGVDTWGFRRLARLERDLEQFRPFTA